MRKPLSNFVAVLSVGCVTLIRLALGPYLGSQAPMAFFILAVTLSAVLGGNFQGLYATFLGLAAGTYFFMGPSWSYINPLVFLLEGIAISIVCGKLRSSMEAAHDGAENFRAIFEFASVGMGQVDTKTKRFLHANRRLCEITGYTLSELCKMTPFELTHPDDRAADLKKYEDYLAGKSATYLIEKRYLRKDGVIIWVRVNSQKMYAIGSHLELTLGIIEDITAQKISEEETSRARVDAEAANMAKSVFLANMSHEIRTPLGAIMGFSDLVIDPRIGLAEKVKYVAAIRRNGQLLSKIINDILDFSRVEAGRLEIHAHDTSLQEILTDTRMTLGLQAQDKGIALNFSVDENLPEVIKTDPFRLRQILLNVIGNSIKFTAQGSINVKVKLVENDNGLEKLAFIVKDTGMGIPQNQVEKLFKPFSQAEETSNRVYGGTGLGLALTKRLSNFLGGDIVLTQNVLGKGCTFMVTIDPGPRHAHENPLINTVQKEFNISQGISVRIDELNILLAEDAPDNQELVSQILMLAGAKVNVASNGLEAIEKAMCGSYDVLLMDLQMPVMDGYEATAELRRHGYSGTIVALTAHCIGSVAQQCLQRGFDDYISKPVNRNDLLQRLSDISKHKPGLRSN
jgi:PAS domain S-box-containing protein